MSPLLPSPPSLPITPFHRFYMGMSKKLEKENPESTFSGIMSRVKAMWNSMSDAEKKPYEQAYKRAIKKYSAEVRAYSELRAAKVARNLSLTGNPEKEEAAYRTALQKYKNLRSGKKEEKPPVSPRVTRSMTRAKAAEEAAKAKTKTTTNVSPRVTRGAKKATA